MRTTLTLDADVARTLQASVRHRKIPFKQAVNEALRAGLGLASPRVSRGGFKVRPHSGGWHPGLDPRKLGQLADELEDTEILRRARRR